MVQIDLAQVKGTGLDGVIVRADVEEFQGEPLPHSLHFRPAIRLLLAAEQSGNAHGEDFGLRHCRCGVPARLFERGACVARTGH